MGLLEAILGGFIINFLGVNARYHFLKIFNKNLKKEDLKNDQEDIGASFSQGFYNFFIGLLVFCIVSIGLMYIAYRLNLL
jgi:hypothetical protein